ncbi:MAG: response regulator, partial [Rhizobiaceae bacterium]
IPPEKCRTVFDKFSQVDGSATRKHEGTGLGLAIASSLVELMGGEMGVESKVGKGSTFWFSITLPAHGEAEDEQAPAVPIDVTGSRILIVDDNAVNRAILLEQMQAWKFDAATASSGAEAIEILQVAARHGMAVDCVILDYHMPEMNGEEAARIIRGDPMLKETSIVMLTSVDQTAEGKAFSSLGINGHLTKPARSAQLLDTLTQALEDSAFRKDGESVDGKAIAAARMIGEMEVSKDDQANLQEEQTIADVEKHLLDMAEDLAESQPAASISQPSVETSSAAGDADTVNVLLADDNEVNRIVLSQILKTTDLSFVTARDGEETIELYHRTNPEIILLDVSMPKINGLEATRAIRKSELRSGRHVPIIGVTAHALKGDMEICLEAGMDDYLSKPVSPDMLIAKIEKWLERKLSRKAV